MPGSTLPPIVWVATCGHPNQVRSDSGGFKVACKTCGRNIWCPKRKGARARPRRPGPAPPRGQSPALPVQASRQPAPVQPHRLISQLTDPPAGNTPPAIAGMNEKAARPYTWCRGCGAAYDPRHPEACPCGRADWVSQRRWLLSR